VDAIAIGFDANATANGTIAVGASTDASGSDSIAIGTGAEARGSGSIALGEYSDTHAARSTAVGYHANAGFEDSTAIGSRASTTRANQMMFGTVDNTYTAPGIVSAASRAAQTGPVDVVTADADGNLAGRSIGDLGLATQSALDDNTEGVATAVALTGVPNFVPAHRNGIMSVNYGTFGNEHAIAVGGAARLVGDVFANGGVGVGAGRGNVAGRAGIGVAW
jgi:hypothetical protein